MGCSLAQLARVSSNLGVNVLYGLNSAAVGGGNRSLLALWSGLRKCEVGVHAIVPGCGEMSRLCREAGVPITVIPPVEPSLRQPWGTLRTSARLLHAARSSKSDLLHSNELRAARRGALIAKILRVPHVCHVRFRAEPQYLTWVFRGLPKPDLFVFNSYALQRELGASLAKVSPRTKQEVVHNGVDLDLFRPLDAASRNRVGILANLVPVKGHEDFLEMARILEQQGVPATYQIIGDDALRSGYADHLKHRARELGLEGRVEFLGFRNDVPRLLRELDVVVCPSHEEPFGRSVIEAMACAKPVVATNVGGIPEIIENDVSGFLVPARSPQDLAATVQRLLELPELRRRIGHDARKRVEKSFSNEEHVRRIHEIYQRLLNLCPN